MKFWPSAEATNIANRKDSTGCLKNSSFERLLYKYYTSLTISKLRGTPWFLLFLNSTRNSSPGPCSFFSSYFLCLCANTKTINTFRICCYTSFSNDFPVNTVVLNRSSKKSFKLLSTWHRGILERALSERPLHSLNYLY